jgi:RND family efflux transporter MFP subunit
MKLIKNNVKKITIWLVIILIAIFGFTKIRAQNGSATDKKFNSKLETTINPKREDITDEITLAGSIDAASKADLRFQSSGRLAWVGVKVGDRVKKYQAIASLDKQELQKKLQVDFNNYRSTLSNFDDTQDKYKDEKDGLTLTDEMKRILLRSQNTLNNSVIAYELSDLAIKYSTLTSPISGIVTAVDQPASGVNVTPANSTFSIIDPNSIYFKSQVDQEDVIKIKVGDTTAIRLDSFSEKSFESKISYIAFTPTAGQSSTVYEVRFELPKDNDDMKYRLGMDGDAEIKLKESKNALTVPIEALNQTNDKTFVYLKDSNNQVVKKNIKTGIETDTSVEILEGLTENDQVIIKK